jgi:hypothetical protein
MRFVVGVEASEHGVSPGIEKRSGRLVLDVPVAKDHIEPAGMAPCVTVPPCGHGERFPRRRVPKCAVVKAKLQVIEP